MRIRLMTNRPGSPTIKLVKSVYPMYELTIDGLTEAVDVLRERRPNRAG